MTACRASRNTASSALLLTLAAACGNATSPATAARPRTRDSLTPTASAAPSAVASPAIGARTLRGVKLGDSRFAPWPAVAVWNDGSVVALYDWGQKVLLWRQADEPRDVSVPHAFIAAVDSSGERIAVQVESPREALEVLDLRLGKIVTSAPLSSAKSVGWLGDVVLLAGVSAGHDPQLVALSGKVTRDPRLAYNSQFVASSLDGATFIAKRSHALGFWIDLFHGGKAKRIEDAPAPRGAAVVGTVAVIVTEESINPDLPPGRQAIAYDVDTGERTSVPNAERPTAVAAAPNGFVFGFEDGHVTLMSTTFAILVTFPGTGRVLAVDASPDGSHIAAAREDGTITVSLTNAW